MYTLIQEGVHIAQVLQTTFSNIHFEQNICFKDTDISHEK